MTKNIKMNQIVKTTLTCLGVLSISYIILNFKYNTCKDDQNYKIKKIKNTHKITESKLTSQINFLNKCNFNNLKFHTTSIREQLNINDINIINKINNLCDGVILIDNFDNINKIDKMNLLENLFDIIGILYINKKISKKELIDKLDILLPIYHNNTYDNWITYDNLIKTIMNYDNNIIISGDECEIHYKYYIEIYPYYQYMPYISSNDKSLFYKIKKQDCLNFIKKNIKRFSHYNFFNKYGNISNNIIFTIVNNDYVLEEKYKKYMTTKLYIMKNGNYDDKYEYDHNFSSKIIGMLNETKN